MPFWLQWEKIVFWKDPFRLAQALAYFQRLINEVLSELNFCLDTWMIFLMYSPDPETHFKHLEIGFPASTIIWPKMKRNKM